MWTTSEQTQGISELYTERLHCNRMATENSLKMYEFIYTEVRN